jgi:hypothetical protein
VRRLGREREKYHWELTRKEREERAQMFMEDRTSYLHGKRWVDRMDKNFRQRINEEAEYGDGVGKFRRR